MQVIATAKNLRFSPKKALLVVNQIKKMPPQDAIKVLDFVPNGPSKPLQKVIKSAIANAKNNNNLDESTLTFKTIEVGKGMVFKRFRAVSRGRAHHILKTTSNIKVVLNGEVAKKVESKAIESAQKAESTNPSAKSMQTEESKENQKGKK